ncbi:MAG: Spx/MgsR family RNA polymerase-binding regulatory protein [Eubacteriales bacterium]|nr:Spx/MgsR family RNA polymerase-binding regulatory protein [Eubacteriales bacterium]MDY3332532.1 Spx/MgsR family RNA polymerase-binding regulatory protein [Gallibacter sp.]
MLLICYKRCSTCKKLENTLTEKNIAYNYRNIDTENPTASELKEWYKKSGLDIKKFFNTSGLVYKDLQLKDKLPEMTLEEKYEILSTNGMLVKRPILITEDKIFVGRDATKYAEEL